MSAGWEAFQERADAVRAVTTEEPQKPVQAPKADKVIVLGLSLKAAQVVRQVLGFESREDVVPICDQVIAEIDRQQ